VVEGARTITVVRPDGIGVPGRVAGADRLTDIAVVVVDPDHRDVGAWEPAIMGSADDLEVGQVAVAIGSPLGLAGAPSVTVGVVSGLGRRIAAEGLVLHDLIQTDAPVGQGSSGGALCDGDGVVVGITTALASDEAGADGLGFAIPAEVARAMAEQLLSGDVRHPWLGIEGADLAATEASVPGIAGLGGVRVVEIDPAGPAAAAGLLARDVIVSFDGDRVTTMSELVVELRAHEPGEVVVVEAMRGPDVVAVELVLAERP
jgi:S1-C subfamily serine protease